MYTSIIVTGSISHDTIMDFPSRFQDVIDPKNLHKLNISFIANTMEKRLGGTATAVSYNLSLLCPEKVIILGAVGTDGHDLLQFYKKHELSTASILHDKNEYSSNGTVVTDANGNQVWSFYYGASRKAQYLDIAPYVHGNTLAVILANHPQSFLHFQNQVIELGMDYLYDPGMSLSWLKTQDLSHGVSHARFITSNDYEMVQILKRLNTTTENLAEKGVAIITTLGSNGVRYQDKNATHIIPSFPIKRAIDPTGGGDAWRGGFLAGIAGNMPIIDSLVQANALASFAVEVYGGVNHTPTQSMIQERVRVIKKLMASK